MFREFCNFLYVVYILITSALLNPYALKDFEELIPEVSYLDFVQEVDQKKVKTIGLPYYT